MYHRSGKCLYKLSPSTRRVSGGVCHDQPVCVGGTVRLRPWVQAQGEAIKTLERAVEVRQCRLNTAARPRVESSACVSTRFNCLNAHTSLSKPLVSKSTQPAPLHRGEGEPGGCEHGASAARPRRGLQRQAGGNLQRDRHQGKAEEVFVGWTHQLDPVC